MGTCKFCGYHEGERCCGKTCYEDNGQPLICLNCKPTDTSCPGGNKCANCGNAGQHCCTGDECNEGAFCDSNLSTCHGLHCGVRCVNDYDGGVVEMQGKFACIQWGSDTCKQQQSDFLRVKYAETTVACHKDEEGCYFKCKDETDWRYGGTALDYGECSIVAKEYCNNSKNKTNNVDKEQWCLVGSP